MAASAMTRVTLDFDMRTSTLLFKVVKITPSPTVHSYTLEPLSVNELNNKITIISNKKWYVCAISASPGADLRIA